MNETVDSDQDNHETKSNLDSIEFNRQAKHKDLFVHTYKGFSNLLRSTTLAVDDTHMKTQ